jgi:serine phosphatase RsbU (regulator of sigma subunit)/anti-sigma regulatory factor (Ser/Thr protein kinase)
MKDSRNPTDDLSPTDQLAQIISMVETTALKQGKQPFSKSVLRDFYRALLPESVPNLPGWDFDVIYRPADILSADFYDFIPLTDSKLVISIGDIAGKGSSAAIQMAKVSNLIREVAPALIHPGAILGEVNRLLHKENNPKAYVTSFIAVLDPIRREIEYANAGHLLPIKFNKGNPDKIEELLITGKPLGIFPQVLYEEKRANLHPGDVVLFLSDGLLEARNDAGEMFSAERLFSLIKDNPPEKSLLSHVIEGFRKFLGDNHSQQDDITLIQMVCQAKNAQHARKSPEPEQGEYSSLFEFTLPSVTGNERLAMQRVNEAVHLLPISINKLENLNTAVIEAVRNAIHHGNHNRPELPVTITIRNNDEKLSITVTDSGSDPLPEPPIPDLQAKLSGKQSPFGWGLFLIQQLVDEMYISYDANHHMVEMIMHLNGD